MPRTTRGAAPIHDQHLEKPVTDRFEFENDGRHFVCSVERLRRAQPETWWWFSVSGEAHARYAPFRAESSDTRQSVQQRVVEYYAAMLARRAEPATHRWQRGTDADKARHAAAKGEVKEAAPAPVEGTA
jgi:hypothetical protein